jgi:hypothetical protein
MQQFIIPYIFIKTILKYSNMSDLASKLNKFKQTVIHDGEPCYVDIEFSETDILISLMSIDTHLRKISAFGSDMDLAVKNFDDKLLIDGIIL